MPETTVQTRQQHAMNELKKVGRPTFEEWNTFHVRCFGYESNVIPGMYDGDDGLDEDIKLHFSLFLTMRDFALVKPRIDAVLNAPKGTSRAELLALADMNNPRSK